MAGPASANVRIYGELWRATGPSSNIGIGVDGLPFERRSHGLRDQARASTGLSILNASSGCSQYSLRSRDRIFAPARAPVSREPWSDADDSKPRACPEAVAVSSTIGDIQGARKEVAARIDERNADQP